MSKSVDKNNPKKIGDNIIIPSRQYKGLFLVSVVLPAECIVLVVLCNIGKDISDLLCILGFISVLIAFGGWTLDKTKYVITPEHIEIKHGFFGRKIPLDQISSYSSTTGNVLFLYLTNGKKLKIEYRYMNYAQHYFLYNVIRKKHLPEKEYSDCQNFKMHRTDRWFGICIFGGILIFFDWIIVSSPSSFSNVFQMIILMLFVNFLLFCGIFSYTYTIYIHDKFIDVKNFGIQIKSFYVNDISDYESDYVTYRGKYGGNTVEELTLNLKNGELGLFFPTIKRQYSDYETFIGYLKANGVPTSSELKARNSQKKPKAKKINENQNMDENAVCEFD
jgi:hypothetical protein